MNLGQLTERAQELFGFDLSSAEFAELYNEARREFARRSKYPRKIVEVGPTVAEQEAYDWPTDLLLPLSVSLNGNVLGSSDPETVQRYKSTSNELALIDNNVWYEKPNEEGVRQLAIYPAPEEAVALTVEYVFRPVPLTESAEEPTEIPEDFHSHPLYYVAAMYYRTVEDNPELGLTNEQVFDQKVSDLERYDVQRRAGNGVFRIPIAGLTA